MKLIFCADEIHSHLKIDAIIFDGNGRACLKYSNYNKYAFCNIARKNYEIDVLQAHKHESLDNVIFIVELIILFFMVLARNTQSTRASLQYLCEIKLGLKLQT